MAFVGVIRAIVTLAQADVIGVIPRQRRFASINDKVRSQRETAENTFHHPRL